MAILASAPAGGKHPRAPVASPADRHRDLARRVRRLGTGSRHGCVERFLIERDSLARELDLLADEIEEGEK